LELSYSNEIQTQKLVLYNAKTGFCNTGIKYQIFHKNFQEFELEKSHKMGSKSTLLAALCITLEYNLKIIGLVFSQPEQR